ncbi:MAG: hypothetical protein L0H79_01895 [Intrasporangium sp.]|uniref:hypothetical protein n=1 Tax=Intrasporangium sp. TaxID=1925024 RepID=UPI0026493B14|nr:hypothetical protein [Intrasporangium sp.]MDN5794488.1 hypothetical protein [Intrasporangium sp.]
MSGKPITAAFVAPYLLEATTRFVATAAQLPGVRLGLVTCDPVDRLPPVLKEHVAAHWRIDDALDAQQILDAVRGLSGQLGRVERLVAALEELQVPVGQVREALGIPGMDHETALNVRDKARMKTVLRNAGIPCARHRLVASPEAAMDFAEEVGFPLVLKPPAGAGARATYRLDGPDDLRSWLAVDPPHGAAPGLLEEFLVGDEHSFDSITLNGQTIFWSISDYLPPPLTVLRNPWIQWSVLLPREIDTPEYGEIGRVGPAALRALGVRDALTHMEWFRRPDGSVAVSEVAARPPGAQITSMIGYAHGVDFYRVWTELVLLDSFTPLRRDYAAGTVYLRGQGRGRVRAVHGIEQLQREIGDLVVESRLPQPGQPASSSYEGEGFIIVRHPETRVVREALARILSTVRVELAEEQ